MPFASIHIKRMGQAIYSKARHSNTKLQIPQAISKTALDQAIKFP
jgi:hypothetical protein